MQRGQDLRDRDRPRGVRWEKLIWTSTPGIGALLRMLLNPRDLVLKDLERTPPSPSSASKTESHHTAPAKPIPSFFELCPTFTYNHAAPSAASEFRRLCEHRGWEKGNPDQKVAWRDFQNALAKQFNNLYGVDVDNLKLWQRVCSTLKIEPLPGNLEEAQEVSDYPYVPNLSCVKLTYSDRQCSNSTSTSSTSSKGTKARAKSRRLRATSS